MLVNNIANIAIAIDPAPTATSLYTGRHVAAPASPVSATSLDTERPLTAPVPVKCLHA